MMPDEYADHRATEYQPEMTKGVDDAFDTPRLNFPQADRRPMEVPRTARSMISGIAKYRQHRTKSRPSQRYIIPISKAAGIPTGALTDVETSRPKAP